jgi:hypothetical protein
MNDKYFSRLVTPPKGSNIKVANPGSNVTIRSNYFHVNPNTQQYRIGDDLITLQQARAWYEYHQVEGKILDATCTTTVGIIPKEYEKVLAHVPGVPTKGTDL